MDPDVQGGPAVILDFLLNAPAAVNYLIAGALIWGVMAIIFKITGR